MYTTHFSKDIWGRSPLFFAIGEQQVEAVELLLRHGARVNLADNRGNTPLHAACRFVCDIANIPIQIKYIVSVY